jgi:hypothetical protein
MRRIATLLATGFEPASLLADLQKPIEQQRLLLVVYQTCTEFGHHGEIKTGIGQFQAQCIFPVNPLTHGIGCLPIGETFTLL